jgi:uncharacterized cupredoxin-like copper-binding protein
MSASRRPIAVAAVLAAGALVVAGCGGGGSKSSSSSSAPPASAPAASAPSQSAGGGGEKLSLQADPSGQLRFNKKTLTAKAGKVTIVMKNPSPLSHDISIEGNGVNRMGQTVATGGTSTVSAPLKHGKYTFYCSVPGHRQAGMLGTLTVK